MKVLFVQPFPMNGSGGGAKIMRFLIQNCPYEAVVVNTAVQSAQAPVGIQEIHIKERPRIPFIENIGRLNGFRKRIASACNPFWKKKFHQLVSRIQPDYIHSVTGGDRLFAHVQNVAKQLNIPHLISIHDDNACIEQKENPTFSEMMKASWLETHFRYVISKEMGEAYCERYGNKDYAIVTDGLDAVVPDDTRVSKQTSGRIYFTGLFHISYEPNFQDLMDCIESLGESFPESALVSRGGYPRPALVKNRSFFQYRDFVTDLDYKQDTEGFDFLYLPLPFGDEHGPFIKLSFSTKLITYLNLELPILYHGPEDAAICKQLIHYDAAIIVTTQGEAALKQALLSPYERRKEVVRNAYKLAKDHFRKEIILERFYNPFTLKS